MEIFKKKKKEKGEREWGEGMGVLWEGRGFNRKNYGTEYSIALFVCTGNIQFLQEVESEIFCIKAKKTKEPPQK